MRIRDGLLAGGIALSGGTLAVRVWRSRQYDVTDEAVIDATPEEVFRAVVDEYDGKTAWWEPDFRMRVLEGGTFAEPGALLANTVLAYGKVPIRFTTRTSQVVENWAIHIEYTDGAFRGDAWWRFEPFNGRTKLIMRWRTRPAGQMRLLAPVLPVPSSHSVVINEGFARLSAYLRTTAADRRIVV